MVGEAVIIDGIHMVAGQTVETGGCFQCMIGVLWIETAVEREDTIGGGEDIHLIAFRGCESFDGAVKFVEHAPLAVLQTAHTLAVGHPGLSVLRYPKEY